MVILGISAFYRDSSAAVVVDGVLSHALQEERCTRQRYESAFPKNAVLACLKAAKLHMDDVDVVACCVPEAKRQAVIAALTEIAPSMDWAEKTVHVGRHASLSANAFFPSPFAKAAVLTLDDAEDTLASSLALGHDQNLEVLWQLPSPHALGLLYSAFAHYTGFRVQSGEYKMMGLAPYGAPIFAQTILDNLISVAANGHYQINTDGLRDAADPVSVSGKLENLLGHPPCDLDCVPSQFAMNVAASIQSVVEDIVLRLARAAHKETGAENLCLGGAVALNCAANGKVRSARVFERIWVPSAPGPTGGAVGAAFVAAQKASPHVDKKADGLKGGYLGPEFSQSELESRLRASGAQFETLSDALLYEKCALAISQGKVLGWFQGGMEFGPRALGNRSILGDPRSSVMQQKLNAHVKYRETFRPFAPSVLREEAQNWFEIAGDSPYMAFVVPVKPDQRERIPAVTHVDGSARVQTVDRTLNPRFHALISAVQGLTGCPLVVNTSFNIRGEPIVATPDEAFRCFMGTNMDVLAVGNCLLHKADQPLSLARNYRHTVKPD